MATTNIDTNGIAIGFLKPILEIAKRQTVPENVTQYQKITNTQRYSRLSSEATVMIQKSKN